MRVDLSQDRARQKREKPDEARGAIGELSLGEELAIKSGTDAGKRKIGSALGEVSEGAALHVNEAAFAGRVHDLQDELARIGGHETEVIVVFTGKWMGGGVAAVEGEGQSRGFWRGDRRSNAGFGHDHDKIVSREWVRRQIRGRPGGNSPQRTQRARRKPRTKERKSAPRRRSVQEQQNGSKTPAAESGRYKARIYSGLDESDRMKRHQHKWDKC